MIDAAFSLDLDAYFARIGYHGPRTASLAALHGISAHHAAAIPFENVDVLLGRGVNLDPQAIEQKLVRRRRGGYCFEQNQLLFLVLQALGFSVQTLSARVRWLIPRELIPPRTHLFIRVELDERLWLTDVGVGGCSLTAALRWEDGLIQTTPHDDRRIVREGDLWFHQVRFDREWLDVCEFTGESMPDIDRQVANWWTSTHADSKFRKNLIVARTGLDGSRRSLLNREFTLRQPNAPASKSEITNHRELLALLATEFDLVLPTDTRFDTLDLP